MKIYKHHVVFSLPIMLLVQLAATTQQQIPTGASSLVTSPRPLVDATWRLQENVWQGGDGIGAKCSLATQDFIEHAAERHRDFRGLVQLLPARYFGVYRDTNTASGAL